MKRLVLFLDGTWNSVKSETNVWRLCRLVAKERTAVRQVVHYDPGVGTKRFEWLRGGALGYGLSGNVLEGYQFIIDNYEDGDEIFIFGFSRGAYTARSVAGLIAKCGLLHKSGPLDTEAIYARYQDAKTRPIWTIDYEQKEGKQLAADEHVLLAGSRRVQIKFIGVWDTVGALGIPFGDIPGLSRTQFQFHHTRLSTLYDHAYHALAIDEHREAFLPTLWTRFIPKVPDPPPPVPPKVPIVEQRWFVGAHADVGGGNRTTLPDLALAWLAGKAVAAGLELSAAFVPAANAERDPITDSFASFMFGIYRLAKLGKPFIRTIQADRVEKDEGWVATVSETIDQSVFRRYQTDPKYRPNALLSWAQRKGFNLAAPPKSVRAKDGTAVT